MNIRLIIALSFAFILAPGICPAARTNLPSPQAATVTVNPTNHTISWPGGFCESNALSRINPSVLLFDITFGGWGTSDGVTWTNASGWTSTAEVTNGVCNLKTNSLLSPWISGSGLESVSLTWSNLLVMTAGVEYSTNDVDWILLDGLTDLRIPALGYRLRLTAIGSVPPLGETAALLSRVTVRGHQVPGRIGTTNDFAGIVIRVDNPAGNRDAVNLQTLETRLAAYVMGGHSAEGWSQFSASNTVDLAGQTLRFDPRYSLSVVGDTITMSMGGSTLLELYGGNTCTPRIVSFRVTGTNLSADVVGAIGWRPYPQWTTNLITPNWTSLSTNQFSSTYPDITNGIFHLSWSSGTNITEFWRIMAEDETGGTNGAGLVTFHVPVSVPFLYVGGREVSPYSPTWVSNADYAASAGMATTAVTSGYATNSGSAQAATRATTSGYATNAGTAATALYSSDGAHAVTADTASRAGFATNSGSASTAAYSTNAGYSTSAGYAAQGSIGGSPRAFGSAAAVETNEFAQLNQSNLYALWTTQRCDAIELMESSITTNTSYLTNSLVVSGSATPSPNGTYTNPFPLGEQAFSKNGDTINYSSYGYWQLVTGGGVWTNGVMLGTYSPIGGYGGSGNPIIALGSVTTNVTYTTNRTVRVRLNSAGIEVVGTNAVWHSMNVLVPGGATNTIRYLGAP